MAQQIPLTDDQKERLEKLKSTFWFFRIVQLLCIIALCGWAWIFLDSMYLDIRAALEHDYPMMWSKGFRFAQRTAPIWITSLIGFFIARSIKENYEHKLMVEKAAVAQEQAMMLAQMQAQQQYQQQQYQQQQYQQQHPGYPPQGPHG